MFIDPDLPIEEEFNPSDNDDYPLFVVTDDGKSVVVDVDYFHELRALELDMRLTEARRIEADEEMARFYTEGEEERADINYSAAMSRLRGESDG